MIFNICGCDPDFGLQKMAAIGPIIKAETKALKFRNNQRNKSVHLEADIGEKKRLATGQTSANGH